MNHETVFGVQVPCLPDQVTPVEVMVVARGFDSTGATTLTFHASQGLSPAEKVGMLEIWKDSLLARVNSKDYQ